jgi:hypothetical protein
MIVFPGPNGSPVVHHNVFQDLLQKLDLRNEHFTALRDFGLPPEEISNRGYRSAESATIRKAVAGLLAKHGAEILQSVPGFHLQGHQPVFHARGLLVPVRNLKGQITGILCYPAATDLDMSVQDHDRTLDRIGDGVHVPLGFPFSAPLIRLVAGELIADVISLQGGVPTLSVSDWDSVQAADAILRQVQAETVRLTDIGAYSAHKIRKLMAALLALTRPDLSVELEHWPEATAASVSAAARPGAKNNVLTGMEAMAELFEALQEIEREAKVVHVAQEPAPFPVDVFPPSLGRFCQEVATTTATPPDFAAVAMLVIAGAAIGASRALLIKNGWTVCAAVYAMMVGEVASGKTPAMQAVLKPYSDIQFKLLRPQKEENVDGVHRLLASDITVEALVSLLAQNPRGLLLVHDEGPAWIRGMSQYKGGRGSDRQFFLAAWNNRPHFVDRKTGERSILLQCPFLNVLCGIQPDMLSEMRDAQGRADGFVERILFAFPRTTPGAKWTDAEVSEQSVAAWQKTLNSLLSLPMNAPSDGTNSNQTAVFSDEARDAWVSWFNSHQDEIANPELPAHLLPAWAKMPMHAARLALILHHMWRVEDGRDETMVQADSVHGARNLIDFFKSHTRLVHYRMGQSREEQELFALLDWVRKQPQRRCSVRMVVRAKKATPTEKARWMLDELTKRGLMQVETEKATNNKLMQWYYANPVGPAPSDPQGDSVRLVA